MAPAFAPGAVYAQQFSPPSSLSNAATTDSQDDGAPYLATDGKGVVVAVWESLEKLKTEIAWHDWDIFVARSSDGGARWSKAGAIASYAAVDIGADNNPVVATDARGNWVAIWQSLGTPEGRLGPDSDILFVRSTDNAKTWSRASALASYMKSDIGQDFHPALLALPGGTWIAAWETSEAIAGKGSDFDIVYSRSSDAGATWSLPLPLNRSATSDRDTDRQVVLAADGKGVVLAAWQAFAAEGGKLGVDWDIMIARSENAGATWSEPAPLASTAASDGVAGDSDVSLATDGSGRWVAVWSSYAMARQGGKENDWDILRVVSTDGGRSWSAPAVLNDSLASDVERDLTPRIVYD
ncbi:MAG: exo-alpha-sialidase, partial [Deltaproteobacteria bacterium]|nr:exo-alpha-sialidase [Deltaproteobacteria bacterium]